MLSLNIPNGGIPVDDYIYKNESFEKIYNVHNKLINLLKYGIIQMNKRHIYHCDIKDSNVLVDNNEKHLKTRLIDWGLSVEYKPDDEIFPKNWRNRPLQFNVPFSVIIFSDSFYEKYSTYLKDGGYIDKTSLKPFVINYLKYWMQERGAGHYKFINEIMFKLFSHNLTNMSDESKPVYIETSITVPFIVDYIVDVLIHYTKFKSDGTLNLREYLNEVYIKLIDVYGFINVYYPLLEMLSNKYDLLDSNQLKIFNQINFIFCTYLYMPRHEPIQMNELYNDFKILGNLIINETHVKRKTSSQLAKGIKTRKLKTKSSLFKRKPFIKRFKNPIFLSLK